MNFKVILVFDGWGISGEIALRWLSLDLTDDKSTLIQVMAWCRQATSHYLSQCWPRYLSPYGVTRPQWVNTVQYNQFSPKCTPEFSCRARYEESLVSLWAENLTKGLNLLLHCCMQYSVNIYQLIVACWYVVIDTGSKNGWFPVQHQAIAWTDVNRPSIRPLRTHFNERLIKILKFTL